MDSCLEQQLAAVQQYSTSELVLQLDFTCCWIMSSCAVVADSGEMLVLPSPS